MENEKPKGNGMEKLATFIVDKRNLFFLLYIFALIFCAIATGWVKVEDDITTYLPDTTETRQGLTVMNDNFVTYGTANVMVSNITYDTALEIQEQIEDIDGVTTVDFDDTDEHYTNASALFSVSFDAEVGDERAENALLLHGLAHALCKRIAEARQRDGRACARKVHKLVIDARTAQNHAQHHIAHQDPCGREPRFVDQKLAEHTDRASDQKCLQIVHTLYSFRRDGDCVAHAGD